MKYYQLENEHQRSILFKYGNCYDRPVMNNALW
jgi:hypothetical protein